MPKRKQSPPRSKAQVDDLLIRTLRAAADEVLEEEVPERLLQVLRAAGRSQPDAAALPPEADRPTQPARQAQSARPGQPARRAKRVRRGDAGG